MAEVLTARLPRMMLPEFPDGALVPVEGSGYLVGYDAERCVGAVYSPGGRGWRGGWTISTPIQLPDFLAMVRAIGIEVEQVPPAWTGVAACRSDVRGH